MTPVDLERFARKCEFDAFTGCVLWKAAASHGKGTAALYGRFRFRGVIWAAHRWAGVHIHGFDLSGKHAGHCCPHGVNSLCVEHIIGQTVQENNDEQFARLGNPMHRANQSAETRQQWLFVSLGITPMPEMVKLAEVPAIPFYSPPAWLQPFLKVEVSDDCPF